MDTEVDRSWFTGVADIDLIIAEEMTDEAIGRLIREPATSKVGWWSQVDHRAWHSKVEQLVGLDRDSYRYSIGADYRSLYRLLAAPHLVNGRIITHPTVAKRLLALPAHMVVQPHVTTLVMRVFDSSSKIAAELAGGVWSACLGNEGSALVSLLASPALMEKIIPLISREANLGTWLLIAQGISRLGKVAVESTLHFIQLWGPSIQHAIAEEGYQSVELYLDTIHRYCLVDSRVSTAWGVVVVGVPIDLTYSDYARLLLVRGRNYVDLADDIDLVALDRRLEATSGDDSAIDCDTSMEVLLAFACLATSRREVKRFANVVKRDLATMGTQVAALLLSGLVRVWRRGSTVTIPNGGDYWLEMAYPETEVMDRQHLWDLLQLNCLVNGGHIVAASQLLDDMRTQDYRGDHYILGVSIDNLRTAAYISIMVSPIVEAQDLAKHPYLTSIYTPGANYTLSLPDSKQELVRMALRHSSRSPPLPDPKRRTPIYPPGILYIGSLRWESPSLLRPIWDKIIPSILAHSTADRAVLEFMLLVVPYIGSINSPPLPILDAPGITTVAVLGAALGPDWASHDGLRQFLPYLWKPDQYKAVT